MKKKGPGRPKLPAKAKRVLITGMVGPGTFLQIRDKQKQLGIPVGRAIDELIGK